MGNRICEICGRPGADALCVRCGRVVCERCFNGFDELCIECTSLNPLYVSSGGISSAGLRIGGMLLIIFGLLITSIALTPEGGFGEGVIVIFPFVFGNIGGWAAVALSIAFLGIFIASSLLPWFLISKRGWGNSIGQVKWEYRPQESEIMEYMITIDLPRELRKTVYIEDNGNVVHLRSNAEDFHRSYTLPVGFEVDEYSYEYEGNYLILKLKLKRTI
jgi:hypothetical protein